MLFFNQKNDGWRMKNSRKYIIWLIIFIAIAVRVFSTRPLYQTGDKIRISATIYSDPIKISGYYFLKISGLKIYLPITSEINYGDRVIIEGKVEKDKLLAPNLVSQNDGSLFSGFRNRIIAFYEKSLPSPESGLLAGIIFGARGAVDNNFYNKTKLSGVAHVVVASGTNVTFVVSFWSSLLFLFLPRKKAIPLVILGVLLYLFVSGFEAPLVRAFIMSGVLFGGQEIGRIISPWRVLLLTAGIMLICQPEWLNDVGFALSFASTASIMAFQKKIDGVLSKLPNLFRQDLSTTLAAQIGVTPILIVIFRQFSIWSPLANALVLWTIPLAMTLGTIGGILGLGVPILGKWIVLLAYPLLWWFVKVVEFFG